MKLVHLFCIAGFALIVSGCRSDYKTSALTGDRQSQAGDNSLAYQWAEVLLEATARDTDRFRPRPTVTSRYLALIFTSMFDAWSRYDAAAVPVYLQGVERRPGQERTQRNKEIAISYAAFRAANEYFFSDTALLKGYMTRLGLDPDNASMDPSTPEGIGNLAARSVIEARKRDGSNQHGDEPGSGGTPFSDYTGYKPANTADENVDINRWQPKYFSDGKGGRFAPGCLTPHWGKVKPMALKSGDQFRSPPPPLVGSEQLEKEVKEVVDLQAGITNEQKALVEFMRDGPASVQQAGHWLKFAMNASARDNLSLDDDVRLFFLLEVAAMDAFIACWDTKLHYDFARPYALVHHYYKGKPINGWLGEGKGWGQMQGDAWRPYSPDVFLCPAFPGYVSGHSTVSGACGEVLKLWFGDDHFGESVKWIPGHLTEPDNTGDTVTIYMPTFTETANMAGISRVLGGYHIQSDNVEGLALGRKIGNEVFAWYKRLVGEERG